VADPSVCDRENQVVAGVKSACTKWRVGPVLRGTGQQIRLDVITGFVNARTKVCMSINVNHTEWSNNFALVQPATPYAEGLLVLYYLLSRNFVVAAHTATLFKKLTDLFLGEQVLAFLIGESLNALLVMRNWPDKEI